MSAQTIRKPAPPSSRHANGEQPASTEPPSQHETTTSDTEISVATGKQPWSRVKQLAGNQGLVMALMGPPGSGKSTFGASATRSEHGRELLIVNFDGELKSLEDRDDIFVWPGAEVNSGRIRDWSHYSAFSSQLRRRKHPFKVIQFDTVNAMYEIAYKKALASGHRNPRQTWGEANDLVNEEISAWAAYAREKGVNVLFVTHTEEKQEGENGPLRIRMQVTPGVVKHILQKCGTVGCLLVKPGPGDHRNLILHNTARVIAKHHQPQTGDLLPLEIIDPDFSRILEHVHGVRPYPKPKVKQ